MEDIKGKKKTAIIIGAGPAGLTAAYELLMRTDIMPIILEKSSVVGGLAKTINYKGNRIDIGPHRFFSKSDRVMNWWLNILPLQGIEGINQNDIEISYQNNKRKIPLSATGPDPLTEDKVLLIKDRFTRIFYLHSFFSYPVSLGMEMIRNLGLVRISKILWSYLLVKLFPISKESSLQDFLINRFGKELYVTFFKDYTEKVWGVPCDQIKPEWGAQRIKGLSVTKVFIHALKKIIGINNSTSDEHITEHFLYPKLGTGQMWDEVASIILAKGGAIHFNKNVTSIIASGNNITSIKATDDGTSDNAEEIIYDGDYFFSTMPVKQLIAAMQDVPANVSEVAGGLIYRDFISVGLLLNKLNYKNSDGKSLIADNWIYVQEPNVMLGRIVVYNNFSPYMLHDTSKVWLGLDYFCDEGDALWNKSDEDMRAFATAELQQLGFIDASDVLDAIIIKEKKSYPAYFGTYDRFEEIKTFTDAFQNLFLIGRNGMHKYNNQDHSMLCAMTAVDNIIADITTKENVWNVNAEQDYHG